MNPYTKNSRIYYKFEEDKSQNKIIFDLFDICKSEQTNLSLEEEENKDYKHYFTIGHKKEKS